MVEIFSEWRRENERRPFNTEAWNRLVRWLSGYASGPLLLVDDTGAALLSSNAGTATVDLGGVFAVSSTFGARLDNATWLLARNAAGNANVNLLRLNASNVVEFGAAGTSLSVLASLSNNVALLGRNAAGSGDVTILKVNTSDYLEIGATGTRVSLLSALTNNTALGFRNAANSATVAGLLLNASDYFEFGAAATRVTILSPLTNNTKLTGRNAANSASFNLIGPNASDQVEVGVAGTQTNLLGTVVATVIDPPTVNGQVTVGSQAAAWGHIKGNGGSGSIATDTSVALGDNYNVASVTYNGAGNYSVAIDRDFANADYAVVLAVDHTTLLLPRVNYAKATTGFDIHVETAAGVKTNPARVSFACFGALS